MPTYWIALLVVYLLLVAAALFRLEYRVDRLEEKPQADDDKLADAAESAWGEIASIRRKVRERHR